MAAETSPSSCSTAVFHRSTGPPCSWFKNARKPATAPVLVPCAWVQAHCVPPLSYQLAPCLIMCAGAASSEDCHSGVRRRCIGGQIGLGDRLWRRCRRRCRDSDRAKSWLCPDWKRCILPIDALGPCSRHQHRSGGRVSRVSAVPRPALRPFDPPCCSGSSAVGSTGPSIACKRVYPANRPAPVDMPTPSQPDGFRADRSRVFVFPGSTARLMPHRSSWHHAARLSF